VCPRILAIDFCSRDHRSRPHAGWLPKQLARPDWNDETRITNEVEGDGGRRRDKPGLKPRMDTDAHPTARRRNAGPAGVRKLNGMVLTNGRVSTVCQWVFSLS
jgi:hypothetical protein